MTMTLLTAWQVYTCSLDYGTYFGVTVAVGQKINFLNLLKTTKYIMEQYIFQKGTYIYF